MSNKNILITGATGFVGNRLAERLALGTDYNVTAMAHRFSGPGLARLARRPRHGAFRRGSGQGEAGVAARVWFFEVEASHA